MVLVIKAKNPLDFQARDESAIYTNIARNRPPCTVQLVAYEIKAKWL